MRFVMGYLVAVCLLLIIISQSIIFPTFYRPFFVWQYDRLNVAETIQVTDETLMEVTDKLLDYMRSRRDSIEDIYAVVAGQERQFFSRIEIVHMVDVRDLYTLAFAIRNIAFFTSIALILTMALFRLEILSTIARCAREVVAGFLIILVLLTGVIALDFNRAFDIFHHIFFFNDYWILDPRVDLLINMVPLSFFIHISIFILGLLLAASALVIGVSTVILRRSPSPSITRL